MVTDVLICSVEFKPLNIIFVYTVLYNSVYTNTDHNTHSLYLSRLLQHLPASISNHFKNVAVTVVTFLLEEDIPLDRLSKPLVVA